MSHRAKKRGRLGEGRGEDREYAGLCTTYEEVGMVTITWMDDDDQEPPRPPLQPGLDGEEAGCVSGMVLVVAVGLTVIMLFIWLLRKAW